ncbi:MAG: hypothetical protein AB7I27_00375 [Bacteriovoracaceae bacterium]
MSSIWNGNALLTRFVQKYGLSDTTSTARVLEWMNEIQEDICTDYNWPFLKFKMKKQITSSDQEIDISPQIPSAPSVALAAGGSLTTDTACYVKVTFVIFDEAQKEFSSIESEASAASSVATPTGSNLKLSLTNIDTFDGSTSVKPTVIHRRVYLKQGSGNYYLAATIEDNTTTTLEISTNPTSTIEPPEYSLVANLSGEDPVIEGSNIRLYESKLNDLIAYDPALSTSGTPQYYVRTSPRRILIYPKPSSTITISYWVYRKPSRIFSDTDRVLQLDPSFKPLLDAGVTWKGYEYKDSDGQEGKLSNYETLKEKFRGSKSRTGGQALRVKEVC